MSSSIKTIGHKLQSLEERLKSENESHDPLLAEKLLETPNRQNRKMFLPVNTSMPAPETETDKKLKKIKKQTGILTISGKQYLISDIQDLKHLADLGNGTSGNVVKMLHVPSDTVIAVKQMRLTGNPEENKRIYMDLDVVLKSDDCPYIVQCLGCFIRDADVWICMELMSMCFDKLLKLSKKPVPEDILGKVTIATVRALSYLKDKHGVIHRDVKPSNILIDERGNIKLCDFGISGRLIESKANTRSAGCAAYMAPERIDPKKPKYDIRADVWSLGITLVELATAKSPYEGCNTDFEVLTKVLVSEPPCLPDGEGFNFSQEFREFVKKCLIKDHQNRPKYLELLEQPFMKKYETANVDVPKWFKSVVKSEGIKTHRTIMPKTTSQDSSAKPSNNKNSNINITPGAPTLPLTTANAKSYTQTQIPSFQQYHQNRTRRDEFHYGHQSTQLPQAIGTGNGTSISLNSNNLHETTDRHAGGHTGGGSSGISNSSCSSSTASSSPISPPNILNTNYNANNEDRSSMKDIGNGKSNESHKCYQKSPFMQKKFGKSSSSGGTHTYRGVDSSKKDMVPTTSVLSSISQSIIRNLTTSPFSQKRHPIPQSNQIDPLWQIPTTENITTSFDCYDSTNINKSYSNSPFLGRKRIPTVDEKIIAAATGTSSNLLREMDYQQKQSRPSLVPNDKRDISSYSQRTHSGHSPIVLQRFYHQQNQLREKEIEKFQHEQHSPERQTNPFLSNYQPTNIGITATTSGGQVSNSNFHYNQYYSHIPIPTATGCGAASTSSHSTSSQSSSTLSTSSQVLPVLHPNGSDNYTNTKDLNLHTSSAFGVGNTGGHLQYQPLPQQYLPSNTMRNSRSPPTSPDQMSEPIVGSNSTTSGSMVSKLNKFYARRQLQATSSLGSSSNGSNHGRIGLGSDVSMNSCKENNLKEDNGWFNTLAGAMKRQFASYVKLQLNSAASPITTNSNTSAASVVCNGGQMSSVGGRSSLPNYQRSISLTGKNGSSENSNSLSPTEVNPKVGIDSSTGSFLRRYAASSGSGSINRLGDFSASPNTNAHILAGLDRRHRSPDPPPRYNRGQSPLLLRKNLLELSGQPPGGSPLLNRRYVTASPPLPPPRRGSESVPGSPQHFRTRIHYTPEPQRRVYRTIDQ